MSNKEKHYKQMLPQKRLELGNLQGNEFTHIHNMIAFTSCCVYVSTASRYIAVAI